MVTWLCVAGALQGLPWCPVCVAGALKGLPWWPGCVWLVHCRGCHGGLAVCGWCTAGAAMVTWLCVAGVLRGLMYCILHIACLTASYTLHV